MIAPRASVSAAGPSMLAADQRVKPPHQQHRRHHEHQRQPPLQREAPRAWPVAASQSTNSLGYSCDQTDYPGKSFRRRHVFQVHIPKTGGSSIERWSKLAGYNFFHEHLMPHMRKGDPADAFRFAFVRSPYSRFVSQYTFCKQGPLKTWNRGFPCHLVYSHNMSFDDWWLSLWGSILRVGGGALPSIRKQPSFQAGHVDLAGRDIHPGAKGYRRTPYFWCSGIWWGNCFGPTSQWVYEDGHSGRLAVDWVGRLENINTDFACLRRLLNDSRPGTPDRLPWTRDSLGNSSHHRKSPASWFRNATIARLVTQHYHDDFDNFRYPREAPLNAVEESDDL